MRRTASDDRCGSCGGIAAEGSSNFGCGGLEPFFSLIQLSSAINQRDSCNLEGTCVGVVRLSGGRSSAHMTNLNWKIISNVAIALVHEFDGLGTAYRLHQFRPMSKNGGGIE